MSEIKSDQTALFLKPTRFIVYLLLVLFLLAGLGVRLIDLTDLPLDFATTRQLHSYIMSRGYFYEMDTNITRAMPEEIRTFGIETGRNEPQIEPPILEYLVAITYRLTGGENMLFARLLSILFWVIGGIPLFLLVRKVTSLNGAYAALALYLFNPFGVIASRSFQPDPMMVMFILWSLYFQFEWVKKDTLKLAILTGVFTGIAVLIKMPAAFFVGFSLVGIVLAKGLKNSIRNGHVYLVAAISLLPALLFYVISATVGGNAGALLGVRWVPVLFSDPKWYLKWLMMAKFVVGFYPIIIALLGFFFIKDKLYRIIYFCMWLGYILYGFMFAYHIYTHDYYHLPLIPVIALGFGSVVSVIFDQLEKRSLHWFYRVLVMGLFLFSVGLCVMKARGDMIGSSYRHEAKYWKDLGDQIGQRSSVIALTHDYGYRLNYWGFIQPELWPTQGDLTVKELIGSTDPEFETLFKTVTEGRQYFLVTLLPDFESQQNLYEYLFDNYPYQQGDGFFLFDLLNPLAPGSE
jgi:4-amino-4-deoxy-L-arabinose transferase-like glycosyltransferase